MNLVEEAREIYRPDEIRVLFLAESPPSYGDRFFYFPDVKKGDSLFLHLIREAFPELKEIETKQVRAMKEELLLRFRDEGFFVEDSSLKTIGKEVSQAQKIKRLKEEQETLNRRIKRYKKTSKLVLLSSPVFKANYDYLKDQGYNILNTFPIPFPGSGQQGNFKRAMVDIPLF